MPDENSDSSAMPKKQIDTLRNDLLQLKHQHFVELGGPHAGQMMESRESAERYLDSPDRKLRRAAILVIADHWGASDSFTEYCKKLLTEESDLHTRMTAMSAISKMHAGSKNIEIGRVISAIATDNSQPHGIRLMAYQTLFRLLGQSLSLDARKQISAGSFKVPEDFDFTIMEIFAVS